MRDFSRRAFLTGAGVAAAAAGAADIVGAAPADAATITGTINDAIEDQGGELYNVKMYGAYGDGTHDDTAAIVAALQAAQTAGGGTVFAPIGTYLITGANNPQTGGGQVEFSGPVGLFGAGTSEAGTAGGNTVFKCGDSTAGIRVVGTGTFRSFQVNGNKTATAPLQHGKLVSGTAQATSGATFASVWVSNSAGNGLTIYGAQNSSYHDCRARLNNADGLYIDGGAGGLAFTHWEESDNAGFGVHADKVYSGGAGTYGGHTEDIHFYSGICDGSSATGVGKMKLVGATNWSFPALSLVGSSNMTGPTVVLDQSSGYGLDFTGCWIWGNSNKAGIEVQNAGPSSGTAQTFLITDDVQWHNSGTTVTFDGLPGINRYSARGWMYENASAVGPSGGPDGDTLLIGRTGPWLTPSFASGWTSQGIRYRINADGVVQFKGSNTSGNGTATALFTLDLGYRPDHDLCLPVQVGSAVSYLTVVAATGVVSVAGVGLLQSVYLDGVGFPVR